MRMILSLAAVAALALLPFTAAADSPLKTVHYRTAYHLTHPNMSSGDYTGVMMLQFYSSGIINGNYRDDSAGTIVTVTGGFSGSKVWLSIGTKGTRQMNGTIEKDGSIKGTLSNWKGPDVYAFQALPTAP